MKDWNPKNNAMWPVDDFSENLILAPWLLKSSFLNHISWKGNLKRPCTWKEYVYSWLAVSFFSSTVDPSTDIQGTRKETARTSSLADVLQCLMNKGGAGLHNEKIKHQPNQESVFFTQQATRQRGVTAKCCYKKLEQPHCFLQKVKMMKM